MAVYYYKNSQILAPFSVVSNEPMFDMTTVSLKTRRASQGHQRWELSFNIQPTDNNIEETLLAGIDNLNADTMVMPQFTSVLERFTATGTFQTAGIANAGATTINVANSASELGIIPKGYFIKFSTHDKLYILTDDINFNSADSVLNLFIYPKLKVQVNSNTQILLGDDSLFSYYKDINNQTGITFTDGVLANPGTITLLEAI